MQARTHVENARALMPDAPTLEEISRVSRTASDTISTVDGIIRQFDYTRVYELLANVASNVGPSEITSTILVGLASIATGVAAGKYVARYWGRRGRPNFIDRWIENTRFRHDRAYFVANLDKELSPEMYETARQHFEKKRGAKGEAGSGNETPETAPINPSPKRRP